MESSPRPHETSLNSNVQTSFPNNFQPLDHMPSHTIATTRAEVALIPGIENGPKEALALGMLGALTLAAVGAAGLFRDRRNRTHSQASRAPGFIEHGDLAHHKLRDDGSKVPGNNHGAVGFNIKREAAAAGGVNPYANPRQHMQGFVKGHMTRNIHGHRLPDAPEYVAPGDKPKSTHGQSTSTYRPGTAPRQRSFYEDRRQKEREAERIRRAEDALNPDPNFKAKPLSPRQPSAMERNKIHRRTRMGQRILGRERDIINPLVDKYSRVILDYDSQEAHIQHHGITGPEARAIRRAGIKVRNAVNRNANTEQRMNGRFRK